MVCAYARHRTFLIALVACSVMPIASHAAGTENWSALEAAFKECVSVYQQPLAGDLMRTIGNAAERDRFKETHSDSVRALSFEHEGRLWTATAELKPGFSVAGVPVHSVYASTCQLECSLAVWGLDFGKTTAKQRSTLESWVDSAPTTPTDTHGDIKLQINTTTDGETVLICDVSG